MKRRTWFILAVTLQIIVLLTMMGMKWSTLSFGTKILLKTEPVDPWDLFRGDYVILSYEISRLDLSSVPADKTDFRPNESVYVSLEKQGRYWSAKSVSHQPPEDTGLAIKGRVRHYWEHDKSMSVEYGIESYYVPQHKGREIEGQRESLDVEVSVDRWGNSALSRLFIDGEEVEFR